MLTVQTKESLLAFAQSTNRVTLLTGAGISAESGIPTFRGPEGYWTVGSREYRPQEMATYAMFQKQPWEVWSWYLYRLGICAAAEPNPGHRAVAAMDKSLPGRFSLITQNVDNLHLQAGSSPENTYQIHGNIFFSRCQSECGYGVQRLPAGLGPKSKGEKLSEADQALLTCPRCGSLLRPHVLWFDESYDETHYRFNSSLAIANQTDLLITVGTSGATNLPQQVAWLVYQNGGTILDINLEENPFSDLAQASPGGAFIQAASAAALPEIGQIIKIEN